MHRCCARRPAGVRECLDRAADEGGCWNIQDPNLGLIIPEFAGDFRRITEPGRKVLIC